MFGELRKRGGWIGVGNPPHANTSAHLDGANRCDGREPFRGSPARVERDDGDDGCHDGSGQIKHEHFTAAVAWAGHRHE